MSNVKKLLKDLTVTTGLCATLFFSPEAFSKGDKRPKDEQKDPAKMEKMIERFSAENMKLRLEKLEALKKAHHAHIDELYALKAKHVTELGKLKEGADLKDEASKQAFFKKFKETRKEFKEEEKKLMHEFRKNNFDKEDGEFKKKMKDRKKGFKNKMENSKEND